MKFYVRNIKFLSIQITVFFKLIICCSVTMLYHPLLKNISRILENLYY